MLTLLRMSVTAALLTLVVVLLRLVLKRAPKWIAVALWGLVALRLLCPIVPESNLSLMPQPDRLERYIRAEETVELPFVQPSYVEAMFPENDTDEPSLMQIASVAWIVGAAAMVLYGIAAYGCLRYRLRGMVSQGERVWLSDRVETAFVIGVLRPRIIVPSSLAQEDRERVLAHERAHLRRGDHVWKPLGFFLLAMHWFNPLLWLAYILLCRDIEMACDERVVRDYSLDEKKAYSCSLIQYSVPHRMVTMCPLAFGGTALKSRIRAVLHYKKPTWWIMIAAAAIGVTACACFMTDPVAAEMTKEQAQSVCTTFEHVYHGATCTKSAICLRCGEDGPCLPHAYTAATCFDGEVCEVCGAEGAQALGHDFVGATCVEKGACSRCGLEDALLPHNYTEPTCTEDGVCTYCGAVGESAFGHNYTEATFEAPKTCVHCGVTDGYALHIHGWVSCRTEEYCTLCGERLPMLPHNIICGVCIGCGYTDPDEQFPWPYRS